MIPPLSIGDRNLPHLKHPNEAILFRHGKYCEQVVDEQKTMFSE